MVEDAASVASSKNIQKMKTSSKQNVVCSHLKANYIKILKMTLSSVSVYLVQKLLPESLFFYNF